MSADNVVTLVAVLHFINSNYLNLNEKFKLITFIKFYSMQRKKRYKFIKVKKGFIVPFKYSTHYNVAEILIFHN